MGSQVERTQTLPPGEWDLAGQQIPLCIHGLLPSPVLAA